MKNTLCIIGNFPETRDLFNYERDDCDIWIFNESMSIDFYKRADVVFQMHAPVIWRNPRNRNDQNHYLWLANAAGECRACHGKGHYMLAGKETGCKACKETGTYTPDENRKDITVYMQEAYPEVLNSARYPLEDIIDHFKSNYFSSSVSYALALGIHKGYQRIEIFGVELATDTEYRYQRDGFTFWCGIAKGCGVDLVYHGQIFDAPMYGYEGDVTLDYSIFENRIKELEPQVQAVQKKYELAKAAISQAVAGFKANGNGYKEITLLAQQQIQAAGEFGMLDGARQENERYQKKADAMREASGGEFIFSRQEFEAAGQAIIKERAVQMAGANQLGPQCEKLLRAAAECKNSMKRKKRIEEFVLAYSEYMKMNVAVGMFSGALAENGNFLRTLDAHIKAAGGSKSEEVMLEAIRQELAHV